MANFPAMYPKKNLYTLYKHYIQETEFSSHIPDVTKKRTLDVMNTAINCAEKWDCALDIGGGSGHYTVPLTQKFKRAWLVEPTVHAEHPLLLKAHKNLSIVHKLIEEVGFVEKMDLILLTDIFEHIKDIRTFIQKLTQMQELGGIVYILTPNPLFCGPAVESSIHNSKIGIYGHERHYFKPEIINLMAEGGYALVYSSYEESPLRAPIRIILRGLSRRDKWASRYAVYRIFLGPVLHLLLMPALFLVEKFVDSREKIDKHNEESCMSAVYIFKKTTSI